MECRIILDMVTPDVYDKLRSVNWLSGYLDKGFANRNYGDRVWKILFGLGCCGPMSDAWRDSETGEVDRKKYWRAPHRAIDIDFSLNYTMLMSLKNEKEIFRLIEYGLLKTQPAMEGMKIKDFRCDEFYRDLKVLLSVRNWDTINPQ